MFAFWFALLMGSPASASTADPLLALFQEKLHLSEAAIDPKILSGANRDLWLRVMRELQFPREIDRVNVRLFPAPELRRHLPEIYVGWVPAPSALYVARLSRQPAQEPAVQAFLSQARALSRTTPTLSPAAYEALLEKACAAAPGDFDGARLQESSLDLKVVRVGDVCLPVYLGVAGASPTAISFFENKTGRLVTRNEAWQEISPGGSCGIEPATPPSPRGQDVLIAIIDSGVDYNHPALRAAFVESPETLTAIRARLRARIAAETHPRRQASLRRFLIEPERLQGIGWDFMTKTPRPMDFFENQANTLGWMPAGEGHGTHVAGLAQAGEPALRLLPIRMIGQPLNQPAYDLSYDVFTLAELRGARVGNISMDGPLERGRGFADAIADHPGLLMSLAAGNGSMEITRFSIASQAFVADNVLRVAAFDRKSGTLSKESNFSREFVDVAADGVDVNSCVVGGGTGRKSGTSMAAPRVARLAALLISLKPELTPPQVKELICAGADQLPALKNKVRCGLINPQRTLELLTGDRRRPNSKKKPVPLDFTRGPDGSAAGRSRSLRSLE